MSCEIIYDKAFIKVDSGIIPMICSGSSNCMEFSIRGRQVRERNWFVLKPSGERKDIYSISEIKELAEKYDEIATSPDSSICRGYYKQFAMGEFKRWFLAGLKSAATIEEYTYAGNSLIFAAQDFTIKIQVTSEAQLINLLSDYAEDATAMLTFKDRHIRKPIRSHTQIDYSKMDSYYILQYRSYYFWKLTPHRVKYTVSPGAAKKFVSEKKAEQYMNKYADRLRNGEIRIIRIENGGAV